MEIRKLSTGLIVLGGGSNIKTESAQDRKDKRISGQCRKRNNQPTKTWSKDAAQRTVERRQRLDKALSKADTILTKADEPRTPQKRFKAGCSKSMHYFRKALAPYYAEKREREKADCQAQIDWHEGIFKRDYSHLVKELTPEQAEAATLKHIEKLAARLTRKFGSLARKPTETEIAEYLFERAHKDDGIHAKAADMFNDGMATSFSFTS